MAQYSHFKWPVTFFFFIFSSYTTHRWQKYQNDLLMGSKALCFSCLVLYFTVLLKMVLTGYTINFETTINYLVNRSISLIFSLDSSRFMPKFLAKER